MTASPANAEVLGYPWSDATTLNQSTYDWGYSPCPSNDTGCKLFKYTKNGVEYGESDPWGYYLRNCTSYVAWKLSSLGVSSSYLTGLGNGGQWYDKAANKSGLTRGTSPMVGAAAVKPTSKTDQFGHVAYVESVNSNGTITVSEYNRDLHGNGGTRTGTATAMGFTEFVYFGPLMANPPVGNPPPGNAAPVASFTVPVNDTDLTINVDGSSSHDTDGSIVSYAWNFGDGSTSTATQGMHQYGVSGTYTISLTVADNGGAQSSTSQAVQVRVGELLGDVNGDGKADAVISSPDGNWYVAVSNGSGFTRDPSTWLWLSQFGGSAMRSLLADVNGDGKADAVVYYPSGDWYVALSDGTKFVRDPNTWHWLTQFGNQASQPMFADVTGDGKADAIIAYPDGNWYVAPSSASSFTRDPNTLHWLTDFGGATMRTLVADITGDGKADAVVYYPGGDWYVAPSNGNLFVRDPNTWHWLTQFGNQPSHQLLADVTGDGKADAIIAYPDGNWYIAPSNGISFTRDPNTWHWLTDFGAAAFRPLLASSASLAPTGTADAFVFYSDTGNWYSAPSTGTLFSRDPSTWLWITAFGQNG